MTNTREFHIGDVLSVATGTLVSLRHIDGIYDLCNFMTGENLMTHQLPRASREAEPFLREQHPDLTSEPIPEITSRDEAEAWLKTLYPKYGETVTVKNLDPADHTVIDPIAEIKMMRPGLPIIFLDHGGQS
ncbi:DUF7736 domain-containing protein [Microbacterium plantarum]|uniref:DUF7736 domain-containing protein n=1 Tax=Microbacterium plantarum TaxID=1816425 RepID=UPI002B4A10C1|nr:hypothetical protein [Microbacterium plantarum]WRK16518.1 hypothetical protein VC184_11430 [Microbacterium plantarum]